MMNEAMLMAVSSEAIRKDWILSYLKVVAHNPMQSPLNQAVAYFQNDGCTALYSRKGWEGKGYRLKEDAKPITLYQPRIARTDDGWTAEYGSVKAYDESSVEGTVQKETILLDIMASILGATDATAELIEPEVLPQSYIRGMYDKEKKIFFLEKGSDKNTQERTMISLYVEELAENMDIREPLIALAVEYALLERYGISHDIQPALFLRLERFDEATKYAYLMTVGDLMAEAVRRMEKNPLNFDERAYLRCISEISDRNEAVTALREISSGTTDGMLKEGIDRFADRIEIMELDEWEALIKHE